MQYLLILAFLSGPKGVLYVNDLDDVRVVKPLREAGWTQKHLITISIDGPSFGIRNDGQIIKIKDKSAVEVADWLNKKTKPACPT